MIIVENIKVVNAMQTKKNVGRYLFSGYVSSSAVVSRASLAQMEAPDWSRAIT